MSFSEINSILTSDGKQCFCSNCFSTSLFPFPNQYQDCVFLAKILEGIQLKYHNEVLQFPTSWYSHVSLLSYLRDVNNTFQRKGESYHLLLTVVFSPFFLPRKYDSVIPIFYLELVQYN